MTGPEHADLLYGSNPGCVAARTADGSAPTQCGGVEAWAVPHRYRYPRPHATRLYVCDIHGRGRADAEPLTDEDRVTIADRHAREDALLAPKRARTQNPGL